MSNNNWNRGKCTRKWVNFKCTIFTEIIYWLIFSFKNWWVFFRLLIVTLFVMGNFEIFIIVDFESSTTKCFHHQTFNMEASTTHTGETMNTKANAKNSEINHKNVTLNFKWKVQQNKPFYQLINEKTVRRDKNKCRNLIKIKIDYDFNWTTKLSNGECGRVVYVLVI